MFIKKEIFKVDGDDQNQETKVKKKLMMLMMKRSIIICSMKNCELFLMELVQVYDHLQNAGFISTLPTETKIIKTGSCLL